MKDLFIKVLRWFAILPSSILVFFLVYGLVKLIYGFGITRYIDTDSRTAIFIVEAVSNFLSGSAFVLTGSSIAPNYNKIVAIVLVGIILIIAGSSLFIVTFLSKDYLTIPGIIFGIIGSITAAVYFFKEKD